MYDTVKIAERITARIKQQGKNTGDVLSNCKLSVNTVSHIKKGIEISYLHFTSIADELDCSVDYLLGRTDTPEINR